VNDDRAQRGLTEIFKHSSVTLDEAGMRELLPILQRFLTDLNHASPPGKSFVYRLANLADGQMGAVLGLGPTARTVHLCCAGYDFEVPGGGSAGYD
jgi:hypothetical protein